MDYALYDLNQTGSMPGSPLLISGSPPGDGAIIYSPTGSYVLITDTAATASAAASAAAASDTKGAGSNTNTVAVLSRTVNASLGSQGASARKDITSAQDLANEVFSVTPGGSTQYQIALTPNETFYFKPNISATFASATSRLTQIGADSQDNSASMITTSIGAVASIAAIAGVVAADQPPRQLQKVTLPYVLDLTPADVENCVFKAAAGTAPGTAVATIDESEWCPFDLKHSRWKYRLEIVSGRMGKPMFSETDASAFFADSKAPTGSRLFPFSPCLQVFLHLRDLDDSTQGRDVVVAPAITIADPSRIETYLIPAKGTIAIDNVCGANITPQSYTPTTNLDDLKALADGIAQLKSSQGATSTGKATTKATGK
ncbi:hypothetical protein [Paraburkholderia sp. J12]|uniref:hypothetical protein n=1 Tax=Paraburkholderia sp. J12 TaxID=2805432 RepID=UPI002ABE8366|nr:hypothetical protein [Paraburkholderia sp. J12]